MQVNKQKNEKNTKIRVTRQEDLSMVSRRKNEEAEFDFIHESITSMTTAINAMSVAISKVSTDIEWIKEGVKTEKESRETLIKALEAKVAPLEEKVSKMETKIALGAAVIAFLVTLLENVLGHWLIK